VITATDLGQIDIPPLNISGLAQYDPWQVAVEAARVSGPWRVAIGATYKHWPAYPGPVEATVRCKDAPEPDVPCGAIVPEEPGFSPVVAPHLGAERRIALGAGAELAARAGYGFEPSPAPEQAGRTNYFDNHRSVFSLGWGLTMSQPLPAIGFDAFAQLQWLHARAHDKQAAAGALMDGTVDTGVVVLAGGTAATVRF